MGLSQLIRMVLVANGLGIAILHSAFTLAGRPAPSLWTVLISATISYIAYVFGPSECR